MSGEGGKSRRASRTSLSLRIRVSTVNGFSRYPVPPGIEPSLVKARSAKPDMKSTRSSGRRD